MDELYPNVSTSLPNIVRILLGINLDKRLYIIVIGLKILYLCNI